MLLSLLVGGAACCDEYAAVYTAELWSDKDGHTAYLDNLDLTLQLGGEQWTAFAYALYNNGTRIAPLVDTVQGVSNIAAHRHFSVYEAWGEWRFADLPMSLRAGLYDLNAEFDAIERAALFVNPSHGIGVDFSQTGVAGPSIFPLTSLAVRLDAQFDPWIVRAAVLDAKPEFGNRLQWSDADGALIVAEANREMAGGWRVGLGAWRYSKRFATDQDDSRRRINAGWYALSEGPISRDIGAFVRVGEAEDRINRTRRYIGGGIVVSDNLGVGVSIAQPGAARAASEAIVEVTYRWTPTSWLALQTDAQYVRHPNFDAVSSSVWLFGLRVELVATSPR